MDIRPITEHYAVAPQFLPEDMPVLLTQVYAVVVCNHPDEEGPTDLQADILRIAADAAGLSFLSNPVHGAAMTLDHVEKQSAILDGAAGPALA